jgi:hypothetical protein
MRKYKIISGNNKIFPFIMGNNKKKNFLWDLFTALMGFVYCFNGICLLL